MTVLEWIKKNTTVFPEEHLNKIITAALDWSFSDVVLQHHTKTSDISLWHKVESIFRKRQQGIPLQYLTGEQAFWKDTFKVGPGVLIPRKETEHLIEKALHILPRTHVLIAELGVGSGNMGISLLKERPDWKWLGFEINPESIPYAKENITTLLGEKTSHYQLISGDFFTEAKKHAPFGAILSNPPYVAAEEMGELSQEVKKEPELALNGGRKGLEIPEKLIVEGYALLVKQGWLMCEIGQGQAQVLSEKMKSRGYVNVSVFSDFSGIERLLVGQKGG